MQQLAARTTGLMHPSAGGRKEDQAARGKTKSPVPSAASQKESQAPQGGRGQPRTSTSKTHNTPNTQNSRKHPHPGHPATAPLLREGSGKPAGPKGQPMLSLKGAEKRIRCRPLGGGEAGKRPNPQTRTQNHNTTTTEPRPPTRGEDGLHWYRDGGRSRRRELI